MHPTLTNIGEYITLRYAGMTSSVAAGAGDNTANTVVWIDRLSFTSAKAVLAYKAVLAAAATLTLGLKIRDAADSSGTGAADFGTSNITAAVVATGPGGGGTLEGLLSANVDLTGARRWITLAWTPDLSASGTDTATVAGLIILGGALNLPA